MGKYNEITILSSQVLEEVNLKISNTALINEISLHLSSNGIKNRIDGDKIIIQDDLKHKRIVNDFIIR